MFTNQLGSMSYLSGFYYYYAIITLVATYYFAELILLKIWK